MSSRVPCYEAHVQHKDHSQDNTASELRASWRARLYLSSFRAIQACTVTHKLNVTSKFDHEHTINNTGFGLMILQLLPVPHSHVLIFGGCRIGAKGTKAAYLERNLVSASVGRVRAGSPSCVAEPR